MAAERLISLPAGAGGEIEVYLVRLADGRTVARTREELAELPAELRLDLEGLKDLPPGE